MKIYFGTALLFGIIAITFFANAQQPPPLRFNCLTPVPVT